MPEAPKKQMTTSQLVGQLDKEFADDEWQESTHATPEQEFNGPDKKYPVRLKTVAFGRKKPSSPLWFRFDFVVTRDDPKFQGQKISKFISLKDTARKDKRDYLEDLFCDIQLLLGKQIEGISKSDLPALIEELKEVKPTAVIRVNTSTFTGDDGGEVEMKWVNILGPESGDGPARQTDYSSLDNDELAAMADANGDEEAASELSSRLEDAGDDPSAVDDEGNPLYPTWQAVADFLNENGGGGSDVTTSGMGDEAPFDEDAPVTSDEDSLSPPSKTASKTASPSEAPTPDELLELAALIDENSDDEAYDRLVAYCSEYGVDSTDEKYEDFNSVAEAVIANLKPSEASSQEETAVPEKGDTYLYAVRKGVKEAPCKVTKVLKRAETVDLKRLSDDKVFEAVPFDKLGQLVE